MRNLLVIFTLLLLTHRSQAECTPLAEKMQVVGSVNKVLFISCKRNPDSDLIRAKTTELQTLFTDIKDQELLPEGVTAGSDEAASYLEAIDTTLGHLEVMVAELDSDDVTSACELYEDQIVRGLAKDMHDEYRGDDKCLEQ